LVAGDVQHTSGLSFNSTGIDQSSRINLKSVTIACHDLAISRVLEHEPGANSARASDQIVDVAECLVNHAQKRAVHAAIKARRNGIGSGFEANCATAGQLG